MPVQWITVQDTVEPTHEYAPYAVELATYILFKLSGEKYQGLNSTTEMYGLDATGSFRYLPTVNNGQIQNLPYINDRLYRERKLYLTNKPVRKITKISIDGRVLDPSEYSLRNNAFVVRTNGQVWTPNENYGIEISYEYGMNPPAAGVEAAIQLANQFLWSEMESSYCTLPERVTTISRQNMTIGILDPQDFLQDGRTGVYKVDMFLKASNPSKAKKKPRIYSADKPRSERIN